MKNWHCYIDNQTYGPYPENLLRELINRGQLTVDTYVFNDSPEETPKGWQRAGDTEITVLFMNNSQWTQSIPTIKSNNAYEPGRHEFEEETKSEKPSVIRSGVAFLAVFLAVCALPVIVIFGPVLLLFTIVGIVCLAIWYLNYFQHNNQNNQKIRSLLINFLNKLAEYGPLARLFEYFSKKEIVKLIGAACVVFILAFTMSAWFSQPSPEPTRLIPALTPSASTSIAPKPIEVKPATPKPVEVKRNVVDTAPPATKTVNDSWKTEAFGGISFKVDSSWRQELDKNGSMSYCPPTTTPTGAIIVASGNMKIGNLSDAGARTVLDKFISMMFDESTKFDNAKIINRTYLKIGDKYAARFRMNFDVDDKRSVGDMVMVLFEDGFTLLFASCIVAEYETSYKNIFETTLNSVALAKAVAKPTNPSGSTPTQSGDSAYQAIYDEYSKKIRAATPRLINEYNAEAAKNSDGLMGLAEISMAKVSKLAEISTEGVSEMAEIMMSTGMGKYDVYEKWSGKLMDVYTEEAGKITDAYMSSASW